MALPEQGRSHRAAKLQSAEGRHRVESAVLAEEQDSGRCGPSAGADIDDAADGVAAILDGPGALADFHGLDFRGRQQVSREGGALDLPDQLLAVPEKQHLDAGESLDLESLESTGRPARFDGRDILQYLAHVRGARLLQHHARDPLNLDRGVLLGVRRPGTGDHDSLDV